MKNLKIKKINAVQNANVVALLYIPLGLVYVLIGAVMYSFTQDIVGAISFLVMGALLPIFGWAMVALMTLLTNLALKITGGIAITFEEVNKSK